MSGKPFPMRGEVWMADMGTGRGREQAGNVGFMRVAGGVTGAMQQHQRRRQARIEPRIDGGDRNGMHSRLLLEAQAEALAHQGPMIDNGDGEVGVAPFERALFVGGLVEGARSAVARPPRRHHVANFHHACVFGHVAAPKLRRRAIKSRR